MEVDGGEGYEQAAGGKHTGTVKWFNSQKGFGFITPSDGGADIFVHQSEVHSDGFRSLDENESVEYEVTQGNDGRLKAANVTGPGGAFVKGAPRSSGGYGDGGYGGGGGGGYGGGRGGRGGYGDGSYGGGGYGRGGYGGGGRYGGGGGGGGWAD